MMRGRGYLSAALLVALAGTMCARTSNAQGKPAAPPSSAAPTGKAKPNPYDADTRTPAEKAKQRYKDGIGFALKKDWPNAYKALFDAWGLVQNVPIALNLGKAEIETERYVEAIGHLQYVLDHAVGDDANGAQAKEWMGDARRLAGKVTIVVHPDQSRIFVDGTGVGKAPLPEPVLVDPGEHQVEARLGTGRAERTVDVQKGTSVTVELTLPPDPSESAGPAASDALTPSSPSHGSTTFWTTRHVLLLGGGLVTVVGLGFGTSFGVQSILQGQWNEQNCTKYRDPIGQSCWRDRDDGTRRWLAQMATGFLGAGAVIGLATSAYWLFGGPRSASAPAKEATKTSVIVAPLATPSGGGLLIQGAF